MSRHYTRQTKALVNQTPIPDDGSQVTANQSLWDTLKTDVFDPLLTKVQSFDTALVNAFAGVEGHTAKKFFYTAEHDATGSFDTHVFASDTTMAFVIIVAAGGSHENASFPGGSALSTPGNGGRSGEMAVKLISDPNLGGETVTWGVNTRGDGAAYDDTLGNTMDVVSGGATHADQHTGTTIPQPSGDEDFKIRVGPGGTAVGTTPGSGAPSPLGALAFYLSSGTSVYGIGHGQEGAPASQSFNSDDPGRFGLIIIEF